METVTVPLALLGRLSRPGDSTSRLVHSYGEGVQEQALFSTLLGGRRPGDRPRSSWGSS